MSSKRYYGLYGSAKGWLIASLAGSNPCIAVFCRDRKSAEELQHDLQFFIHEIPTRLVPGWDILPFEPISPETIVSAERISALMDLKRGRPGITIFYTESIVQRAIAPSICEKLAFVLTPNARIKREDLISRLELCGFIQAPLVESVGEFAVRGGVIDIYPSTSRVPLRIELPEETVEGIRTFDADSQRTTGSTDSISIVPVREIVRMGASSPFHPELTDAVSRLKERGRELETPPREIVKFINAYKTDSDIPGLELSYFIASEKTATIFDYIPKNALLVVNDEIGIHQMLDQVWESITDRSDRLSAEHYLIPKPEKLYVSAEDALEALKRRDPVYIDGLELLTPEGARDERQNMQAVSLIELETRLKTGIGSGQALKPLADLIKRWRRGESSIAFVVGSDIRAERLRRQLLALDIDAPILRDSGISWSENTRRSPVAILSGYLSEGVQLTREKLVFIAENQIFIERSYRKTGKARYSLKRLLSSLAQLTEGDFVVHADYGIGVYRGLRHIAVEESEGDFLHIEYADSRLYLPVQNIGKVQKFAAAEGQTPVLDKLASNKWVKTKAKVRQSVAELAGDLIKLYAARSVNKGWRFEPKGAEDDRFADGFPYNETPDQLKAIDDTIEDMATDRVMDRLVCGDVGFGKTEVAIRAAFKCVQHARQVAVLVPTTILVEQHKQNFINRFEGYPVKVAAVSRFYDPKTNQKVLEQLGTGEIDIIIGTHRLLSRDVQFKDLGLVIIDEEHRFGVRQKEKLKALKKSVDVVTLTATPIPRTLHMSLLGIRDISVISTPPQDRRVIRTYVATHDEHVIRDAILREIQRGGQVFYVHNRVQSIDLVTAELARLVPEAKFNYGHGQMSEHQLEKIMKQFLDHSIDVLVSTTIIESGLDIPNANTIIIDRADALGLAQLYQLRGRVGRSTRQAYAYFLVPKTTKLTAEAQQRLKALQSLDDLGLGFNLAMRDMEIRGAGNLLGKEQSGNVVAVGFELYSKILKEAVLNLKGEELDLEESIDPEVKLGVSAFIPDYYIPDISERLILYQRLAAIESNEDTVDLRLEIEDRFGPIGREVHSLLELMRYRALLRTFGVVKAEFSARKLLLAFSRRAPLDAQKVLDLTAKHPGKFKFSKNLTIAVTLDFERISDPSDLYPITWELLHQVKAEEKDEIRG